MALNFAPYQSSEPELERARSPPLRSPTASPKPRPAPVVRNLSAFADDSDPWAAARKLPSPARYADEEEEEEEDGNGYTDLEGGRDSGRFRNDYIGRDALGEAAHGGGVGGSVFQTSLGMPLRLEACLAYLLLPPAGGVILLLFEHKSDYVRFHAWQSALLFSLLFLVHIIFSFSAVMSWILFAGDLGLIGWLSWGAWRCAETLDRVEVPFFGALASRFVDDE